MLGAIGTGDLTGLAATALALIGERPWRGPDGPVTRALLDRAVADAEVLAFLSSNAVTLAQATLAHQALAGLLDGGARGRRAQPPRPVRFRAAVRGTGAGGAAAPGPAGHRAAAARAARPGRRPPRRPGPGPVRAAGAAAGTRPGGRRARPRRAGAAGGTERGGREPAGRRRRRAGAAQRQLPRRLPGARARRRPAGGVRGRGAVAGQARRAYRAGPDRAAPLPRRRARGQLGDHDPRVHGQRRARRAAGNWPRRPRSAARYCPAAPRNTPPSPRRRPGRPPPWRPGWARCWPASWSPRCGRCASAARSPRARRCARFTTSAWSPSPPTTRTARSTRTSPPLSGSSPRSRPTGRRADPRPG